MAQPNFANIQTAVVEMVHDAIDMSIGIQDYDQALQSYTSHQRDLAGELGRFPNLPNVGIGQQLAGIQQTLLEVQTEVRNSNARLFNAQVTQGTAALAAMYSVDQGANPQVPFGQPVQGFPLTPDAISQLAAQACHDLLQALGQPVPQGAAVTVLQRAVRAAIGLPSPLIKAEIQNLNARTLNAQVTDGAAALAAMYSVDQGANPQVSIGQPVQGFPLTPDAISQLAAQTCCDLLQALGQPVPQGAAVAVLQRAVRAAIGLPSPLIRAEIQNLNARTLNAQVTDGVAALAVMYSVDQGANPQVSIGQPVQGFPPTPDAISQLAAQACHDLLQALGQPVPQGAAVVVLQRAVRAAIGLPSPLIRAEIQNLNARTLNAQITHSAAALAAMYSVDQGANAQVSVGDLVQNFPPTPDAISHLAAQTCRDLLRALGQPVPQGATVAVLRRTVEVAIGLPSHLFRAELRNLRAQTLNGFVHRNTEPLAPMYSVDPRPNAQVPIGNPIQNFPQTSADVTRMTGQRCREVLRALDAPVPQNARVEDLRTAVRRAIVVPPF